MISHYKPELPNDRRFPSRRNSVDQRVLPNKPDIFCRSRTTRHDSRVFSFTTLYVFSSKPLFYLKISLDSRSRNFSQVISFGESLHQALKSSSSGTLTHACFPLLHCMFLIQITILSEPFLRFSFLQFSQVISLGESLGNTEH